MAFRAMYPGTCPGCGNHFAAGDFIESRYDLIGHYHPTCPDSPAMLRPGDVVCTTCFLVKPCECDDI